MTDFERANKFWEDAKNRVIAVVEAAGLQVEIKDRDDEFLFDLFDNGDYTPTDDEIIESVKELMETQNKKRATPKGYFDSKLGVYVFGEG